MSGLKIDGKTSFTVGPSAHVIATLAYANYIHRVLRCEEWISRYRLYHDGVAGHEV